MNIEYVSGLISYEVDGVFYHKSLKENSLIPHGEIRRNLMKGESSDVWDLCVRLRPEKNSTILMHSLSILLRIDSSFSSCFSNGFQSWSESREYEPSESMRPLRKIGSPWVKKYHLDTYGDESFLSYDRTGDRSITSHGFTYLKQEDGTVIFCAQRTETSGYIVFRIQTGPSGTTELQIENMCEGLAVPRETSLFDLMFQRGALKEILDRWSPERKDRPQPVTGWTSWYYHYEKISQQIVYDTLKGYVENAIPLDYFQIDDGWQHAVGDWLEFSTSFPDGMAPLSESIRKAGIRPGLWIAPFVAEERSSLCRDHADWIVKNPDGSPVVAGYNPFNWSGNFYSLDIYHPEVRQYLHTVFSSIKQWGFLLVKLDFLYAAALTPRAGRSMSLIMKDALALLREETRGIRTLGCGVPVFSAQKQFNYCRIGSDVSLMWEDHRLSLLRYKERVSTKNSLTSTIARGFLNGRFFGNDPDVCILRSKRTKLNERQKFTLLLVNLIFGDLLFTSDSIAEYTDRQKLIYRSVFPLKRATDLSYTKEDQLYTIDFCMSGRTYTAFVNLGGKRLHVRLPHKQDCLWFETTYEDEIEFYSSGEQVPLAPYQSRCFLSSYPRDFTVMGTTNRLFPASELPSVRIVNEPEKQLTQLFGTLEKKILTEGSVLIKIPPVAQTETITYNGKGPDRIIEHTGMLIGVFDRR